MPSRTCAVVLAALLAPESLSFTDNNVLRSGTKLRDLGALQGVSYPFLGGKDGNTVVVNGYSNNATALMTWMSNGDGFTHGVNDTTDNDTFQCCGDFGVSVGSLSSGKPATVFVATKAGADGIFLQTSPGEFRTVVTIQTKFGPANGTFTRLSSPAVAVTNDKATVHVAFQAQSATWSGVLLASLPASSMETSDVEPHLTIVADTHTNIPHTGVKFTALNGPAVAPNGEVTFFGSHAAPSGSSMVTAQFQNNVMVGTRLRSQHVLYRNHDDNLGGDSVRPGIWRYTGTGDLAKVVSATSGTVPGGQPNETFVAFSMPTIGADGTVACVGLGNNQTMGIFKQAKAGVEAEAVATTHTTMPVYGHTFFDFPEMPSVDVNGNVAFYGAQSSSNHGVYAETKSGLTTLVNGAVQIGDQSTLYVGFGANAYVNGKAAVYMVLANKTNGVWMFDTPQSFEVSV